jgi:hypothetical protein
MRPPRVYAKRSCPTGDPCDLLRLLHGPHRVGLRAAQGLALLVSPLTFVSSAYVPVETMPS